MKYSVTCFFYQLHNIILKPSTSIQNRQTILYIIIIRSICQLFFPRKADQPPAIMFIFFPSSHLSVLPCFSPSFHLSIYLSCFFLAFSSLFTFYPNHSLILALDLRRSGSRWSLRQEYLAGRVAELNSLFLSTNPRKSREAGMALYMVKDFFPDS